MLRVPAWGEVPCGVGSASLGQHWGMWHRGSFAVGFEAPDVHSSQQRGEISA